jgi:hypothetical protein
MREVTAESRSLRENPWRFFKVFLNLLSKFSPRTFQDPKISFKPLKISFALLKYLDSHLHPALTSLLNSFNINRYETSKLRITTADDGKGKFNEFSRFLAFPTPGNPRHSQLSSSNKQTFIITKHICGENDT